LPYRFRIVHRVTVHPIRVRIVDADIQTTRLRGVGFRFVCSCGAIGGRRDNRGAAAIDAAAHRVTHSQR
jgi:hypothetical protein